MSEGKPERHTRKGFKKRTGQRPASLCVCACVCVLLCGRLTFLCLCSFGWLVVYSILCVSGKSSRGFFSSCSIISLFFLLFVVALDCPSVPGTAIEFGFSLLPCQRCRSQTFSCVHLKGDGETHAHTQTLVRRDVLAHEHSSMQTLRQERAHRHASFFSLSVFSSPSSAWRTEHKRATQERN